MKQNTIKKEMHYSGIALHTGTRTNLIIKPAKENTGVVFRRIDLPDKPEVLAHISNVTEVQRATTLSNGKAMVVTVEHILAAFHALNIDNAIVEMDQAEPPIADGSAMPFIKMIQESGIVQQNAEAKYWAAKETLVLENGDTKLILTPSDTFKITCLVSYGETPLDTQYYSNIITPETFTNELSEARTFVAYKDLEYLFSANLAKGGSLDNAVILHQGAIISKDGMRYPDELVRHKVLDIVGDLYLIGKRVKCHIIAVKPSHQMNTELAKAMFNE